MMVIPSDRIDKIGQHFDFYYSFSHTTNDYNHDDYVSPIDEIDIPFYVNTLKNALAGNKELLKEYQEQENKAGIFVSTTTTIIVVKTI